MDAVGRGDLELVRGVDLRRELPGLLRGALEPQRLVPVPAPRPPTPTVATVTGGLGGDGALQGVRVELEDDDALGVPVSGLTTTMPERMGLGMSA